MTEQSMKLPKSVEDAVRRCVWRDSSGPIDVPLTGEQRRVAEVAITAYDREVVEPLVEVLKSVRAELDRRATCGGCVVRIDAALTRYQSMKGERNES